MKKAPLFVLLVALLSGPIQPAAAQGTQVSGTISSDTTWTQEGSPYILTGEVRVIAGADLTIEPGVTVQGNPGSSLEVTNASLFARGTEAQPITFTSSSDDRDWVGITLQRDLLPYPDLNEDELRNVAINNALTALKVDDARLSVAESLVLDDNGVALRLNNPDLGITVTGSVFTNNDTAIVGRVGETATITSNDFWNNHVNVVADAQDPFSCYQGGTWEIHNNDILRGPVNSNYWSFDVLTPAGTASSDYTVSAQDNWWGSPDESRVQGRLHPQFQCCPETPREEVVWQPVSAAPHTAWEPPGEVPDPEPESQGVADPVGWTEVLEPDDRMCVERETVRRVEARFNAALGDSDEYVFKIARLTPEGLCKTWSERRKRFRPGCHRWVSPTTVRDNEFVFRFPRTPTQGRYMLRSAFVYGDSKERAIPGLNTVRLNLI